MKGWHRSQSRMWNRLSNLVGEFEVADDLVIPLNALLHKAPLDMTVYLPLIVEAKRAARHQAFLRVLAYSREERIEGWPIPIGAQLVGQGLDDVVRICVSEMANELAHKPLGVAQDHALAGLAQGREHAKDGLARHPCLKRRAVGQVGGGVGGIGREPGALCATAPPRTLSGWACRGRLAARS